LEEVDVTRSGLPNESRLFMSVLVPKLGAAKPKPSAGGNDCDAAADRGRAVHQSSGTSIRGENEHSRNEKAGLATSGLPSWGISMLEKAPSSERPSSARRARRRMESLSPRLMFSSWARSSVAATPMTSADSRRVESEDCRRWCECRRELGAESGGVVVVVVAAGVGAEVSGGRLVVFVEWEKGKEGGAGPAEWGGKVKDVGEREMEALLREWERPWWALSRLGSD
jgi:hypothetical protein